MPSNVPSSGSDSQTPSKQTDSNDSIDSTRTYTPLPEWEVPDELVQDSPKDEEISNESAREEQKDLRIEFTLTHDCDEPTLNCFGSAFMMPYDRYNFGKNKLSKGEIHTVRHFRRHKGIIEKSYSPKFGPVPDFEMRNFYTKVRRYGQRIEREGFVSVDKMLQDLRLISEFTNDQQGKVYQTLNEELWYWAFEHIDCIAVRSEKVAQIICSLYSAMFNKN